MEFKASNSSFVLPIYLSRELPSCVVGRERYTEVGGETAGACAYLLAYTTSYIWESLEVPLLLLSHGQ